MEAVSENALHPLYFVGVILDTDTSQLACTDTKAHVFQPEKRLRSMVFAKKFKTSSFEGGGPSSFIFVSEKRYQPCSFLTKLIVDYAFSDRKPKKLRPFQAKNRGPEVMELTVVGQRRDLANPLAFEPLSL